MRTGDETAGQRASLSRLVEHLMHAADREFLAGYRVQADRADQNDACPDRVDQAGLIPARVVMPGKPFPCPGRSGDFAALRI